MPLKIICDPHGSPRLSFTREANVDHDYWLEKSWILLTACGVTIIKRRHGFFFQNGGVSFIGEGSLCIFLSMQSFLFQFADVIAIIRNKTRAMATPGALLVFEMSTESCKRLLYFVPFFPLNLNGYFLGIKNLWLTVYRSGSPWKTNYSMFINWRFVVVHNTIVIQ